MPIQQSVDVAVPIKVAYNRWTQFEDWPEFMHRFESVDQADDTTLTFSSRSGGSPGGSRPRSSSSARTSGSSGTSPRALPHRRRHLPRARPRLTRIEVSLDFDPHGMMEKMARGMRFTKRAVRADLHRFKAWSSSTKRPRAASAARSRTARSRPARSGARAVRAAGAEPRAETARAAGVGRRARTGREPHRRPGRPRKAGAVPVPSPELGY